MYVHKLLSLQQCVYIITLAIFKATVRFTYTDEQPVMEHAQTLMENGNNGKKSKISL